MGFRITGPLRAVPHVLDGLDEATLHAHYGVPVTDVRVKRRTLTTLRETRAIAERRARYIEAAHLLRLRAGNLPSDAHFGTAAGYYAISRINAGCDVPAASFGAE
ncbi:hypothetical protein [Burkholderia vietnamiensis]|jgi:hypothetical protein|uniref:hypothetical protein n=1 Tax=Burkholderia vietnamiensis TaxID=60552 RepID=UPI000AEE2129|nr:hypothetical protein [Burkholderia vietnamiensis]MCA8184430.1 hypothetical protein [Burkholderia vietnamiensis]